MPRTDDGALGQDTPGVLRFGEASKLLVPKILDLKPGAELTARCVGNHEAVGRGERL